MDRILISGVVNVEVTLQVDAFPISYEPVRYPAFGIQSSIGGVGYNIARALTVLGREARLASMIGPDLSGRMIRQTLQSVGLTDEFVVEGASGTPQSVILFDREGRRQISTDLRDIRECHYPMELFDQALQECSLAVLTNIQFSRPLLARARRAGVAIATDVHAIQSLDDEYNAEFMRQADILFMSHEQVPEPAEVWAKKILDRYGPEILVIGLGDEGALLATRTDHFMERLPGARTRPIVSTVGAGDALFACFLGYIHQRHPPIEALHKAMVFASYKMGEAGAAQGFLTQEQLDNVAFQPT